MVDDWGVYALLINLDEAREIRIGALGVIYFPKAKYVYIGSAQRNLSARIRRHYSQSKKFRWHIDYFLAKAKLLTHFSLPLPRWCEETVAIRMTKHHSYIPGFGASDSRAKSHLFYGGDAVWDDAKKFMSECA